MKHREFFGVVPFNPTYVGLNRRNAGTTEFFSICEEILDVPAISLVILGF